MKRWLARSWFLLGLFIVLPGGMLGGWISSEEWRTQTAGHIQPAITTFIILFLMSLSLDTDKLKDSMRAPTPVIWGAVVNIGLLPLICWPIAASISLTDFSLGLAITTAVPCTLATASISTRQAGGNDAVSLQVTLLTNLISVLLTPLWLRWTASLESEIDISPIVQNLAMIVLLPTLLGQFARMSSTCKKFAMNRRILVAAVAQILVLLIVSKTAIEAGGRMQQHSQWPKGIDLMLLSLQCLLLHVGAMVIAEYGGRWLGVSRDDRIALVFAGSQKTLPVGLLLAATPAVTGSRTLPFITIPILLFHALQLVIDSAVANQIARSRDPSVSLSET